MNEKLKEFILKFTVGFNLCVMSIATLNFTFLYFSFMNDTLKVET